MPWDIAPISSPGPVGAADIPGLASAAQAGCSLMLAADGAHDWGVLAPSLGGFDRQRIVSLPHPHLRNGGDPQEQRERSRLNATQIGTLIRTLDALLTVRRLDPASLIGVDVGTGALALAALVDHAPDLFAGVALIRPSTLVAPGPGRPMGGLPILLLLGIEGNDVEGPETTLFVDAMKERGATLHLVWQEGAGRLQPSDRASLDRWAIQDVVPRMSLPEPVSARDGFARQGGVPAQLAAGAAADRGSGLLRRASRAAALYPRGGHLRLVSSQPL